MKNSISMKHIDARTATLGSNGWELLIQEGKPLIEAKPQNLVKIIVVAVSPMDYDSTEPVRSVNHLPLWVQIQKEENEGLVGIIKSKPEHDVTMKDGMTFQLNDTIFFEKKHIGLLRA